MRFTLALIALLVSLPLFASDADCQPLDASDVRYPRIQQRLEPIFDTVPPIGIFDCGEYGFSHAYVARYAVYEVVNEWTKRAEVTCWTQGKQITFEPYSCSGGWFVEHKGNNEVIFLHHEIALSRVLALRSVLTRQLASGIRLTRMDFTPVAGGQAWSASRYGYQLFASDGSMHTLKEQCTASSCQWSVEANPQYHE